MCKTTNKKPKESRTCKDSIKLVFSWNSSENKEHFKKKIKLKFIQIVVNQELTINVFEKQTYL